MGLLLTLLGNHHVPSLDTLYVLSSWDAYACVLCSYVFFLNHVIYLKYILYLYLFLCIFLLFFFKFFLLHWTSLDLAWNDTIPAVLGIANWTPTSLDKFDRNCCALFNTSPSNEFGLNLSLARSNIKVSHVNKKSVFINADMVILFGIDAPLSFDHLATKGSNAV